MSHLPQISVSQTLREKFAEMKDGHIRIVVVTIDDEQLIVKDEFNAERSFNLDFERMISQLVHAKHPGYYFIRLDSISEINGHDWLLIHYIPDEANVRERMLYTSTAEAVKRAFGSAYITEEIRVLSRDDMTLESVHQHMHSRATTARNNQEEEMLENHHRQGSGHAPFEAYYQASQATAYPFDENVIEAIHLFKKHKVDYIQFDIDHDTDRIVLSHSEAHATPEHIQKHLPNQEGRFHIYRFRHDFHHVKFDSIIFLYSIPGHRSQVKQRTAYASSKNTIVENIEKKFGIVFDKQLEIYESGDLTVEFLLRELHSDASRHTTTTSSITKTKTSS